MVIETNYLNEVQDPSGHWTVVVEERGQEVAAVQATLHPTVHMCI